MTGIQMPREDGRSDPQTRGCLAASDIIRDLQLAVVGRRPATLVVRDDAELLVPHHVMSERDAVKLG